MPAPTALTRRPTPSVSRVAVPPRARPPVARPASGRPIQPSQPVRRPAPRPAPRHRQHPAHRRGTSGFTLRSLLLGLLVLATIGAGIWWVALRGTPAPSRDFVRVEARFVEAARAIPESVSEVTHVGALLKWNKGVDERLAVMELEIAHLQVVARESEGRARTVARDTVAAANAAVALAQNFRYEINAGKNLTYAADARLGLYNAIDELEANVAIWKKL